MAKIIKNEPVGIKIAKQPSKGAPRDGCFRDISPAKENPQCPYTNPAVASKDKRGVEAVTKKMGEN
jgi:hypothetical protein